MGRRAKNKQAAPIPFSEARDNGNRPSPKKLGKRKAEAEDTESNRPVKKAKEIESKGTSKSKTTITGKAKDTIKSSNKERKANIKGRNVMDGSDEASEGWDDVEDGVDLKAQTE
jgi:ribosomal RNA methyltransferase Nop2